MITAQIQGLANIGETNATFCRTARSVITPSWLVEHCHRGKPNTRTKKFLIACKNKLRWCYSGRQLVFVKIVLVGSAD